jgi:hypothetical protein
LGLIEKQCVLFYGINSVSRFISFQAASEVLKDEGLFEEEEEDKTGTLAMCVSCIHYFLEVDLLTGFAFPSSKFADVLERTIWDYEHWLSQPSLGYQISAFQRSCSRRRKDKTSQQC